MGKGLVNRKKWTQDEFRTLVVLFLTVIYPVLASSFFTIFFLILMPMFNPIWGSHLYWLTAALVWVVLCAVILPCFRDTQATVRPLEVDYAKGPEYPLKQPAVHPFVIVEEVDEKKRDSLSTNKSRESSESIEKGILEGKADKESIRKSKENISQSSKLLNESVGSLGADHLKEEVECERPAREKKDEDKEDDHDVTGKKYVNNTDKNYDEFEKQNKNDSASDETNRRNMAVKKTEDNDEREATEDSPEVHEPFIEQTQREPTAAAPLQVEKGTITEGETAEEERVMELEEATPTDRRDPIPTVDASRANGYNECNMPTLQLSRNVEPKSNVVFLYVNPDMASAEKDVGARHQGEVEEQKQED